MNSIRILGSPGVNKGVVKHACREVFVGFGFVVFNVLVSPIEGRILNDVKVTNKNCVLCGVRGVGVEEIFIEGK